MILDFIMALFYIGIVYSFGLWTVKWFFANDDESNSDWLAWGTGFSGLTLLSTFLYFICKMPVQVIRGFWLLLGVTSVFSLIRHHMFRKSGGDFRICGRIMVDYADSGSDRWRSILRI